MGNLGTLFRTRTGNKHFSIDYVRLCVSVQESSYSTEHSRGSVEIAHIIKIVFGVFFFVFFFLWVGGGMTSWCENGKSRLKLSQAWHTLHKNLVFIVLEGRAVEVFM